MAAAVIVMPGAATGAVPAIDLSAGTPVPARSVPQLKEATAAAPVTNRHQKAREEFRDTPQCRFHLETPARDVARFKALFELLYKVMGSGTLVFNKDGMYAEMQSAGAIEQMMVALPAKKNLYFFRGTEEVRICVDFKGIWHQLRTVTRPKRIMLEFHENQSDKLRLIVIMPSGQVFAWDINIMGVSAHDEGTTHVAAVFDMRVCMDAKHLHQILSAADGPEAEIQFLASLDALYTNAAPTSGTTRVNGQRSRMALRNLKDTPPPHIDPHRPITIDVIQSYGRPSDKQDVYNVKYLQPFAQVGQVAETVELFLGADLPLLLRIPIGSMGTLVYIVTPLHADAVSALTPVRLAEVQKQTWPELTSDVATEGGGDEAEWDNPLDAPSKRRKAAV
jgi:hypothetical protein